MKRYVVIILSAVFCVFVTGQAVLANEKPTLTWVGCGISKKAYLTALAKAYEKNTGVKIDVQGGGATRGIRDVESMSADIGGSCRHKIIGSDHERGVMMVPVAWDALVVIVHKDNPLENISLDNLRKVYLGQITNWKALGGSDAQLKLYVRQGKISGVGRTTRKLLFANYDQEFVATQTFPSSGPLEKALVNDPHAIAITGISSARKRDVKILKVEGNAPTYDNVKTGEYLMYRPLYLVYNENSPHVDTIKDFIRFADTDEGRKIIRANKTVPYLEAMHLMRRKLAESKAARHEGGLQDATQ